MRLDMKKFYTFLMLVLIGANLNAFAGSISLADVSNMTLPVEPKVVPPGKISYEPKLQADQPLYILFNNFEAQTQYNDGTNNGKIIGNLVALMYGDSLYQRYPNPDYNYLSNMVITSYSDATFSKYNLTDFDVAIFPLGDYPLNATTQGGIKVIDKIKEMLDAGKRVMLIGRSIITWALYDKDPVVLDFLANTLGIDFGTQADKIPTGTVQTIQGNTYIPFHIANLDDPIGKQYDYYCNVGWGRNNATPALPLRLNDHLDIFRLKPDAAATGFAYLNQFGELSQYPNDIKNVPTVPGIWVGCHANIGDGKIAFWSMAPDVCALNESPYFARTEQLAMDWFTKDLPKADAWIDFETTQLDFGETLIGVGKPKELRYRNFGRKPLTINKIYFQEWEAPGIFTITSGGQPEVLQPGDMRTMTITFTPDEARTFQDYLVFESDAVNASTATVSLTGVGGKDVPTGPEITVPADTFKFNTLDVGSMQTMDFYFESSGTSSVIVQKIEFIQNDGSVFNFPKSMNFPIVVQAGDRYTFSVRFVPTDYGKVYNCILKITSNANKNSIAYLYGQGKTISASQGAQITASVDTLNFGPVKPLNSITKELDIINTGQQALKIQTIYFSQNDDATFSYPASIDDSLPISIVPGGKLKIPVSFKPFSDGINYFADLGMFTNSTNVSDFHVYFTGKGDNNGALVKEEVSNKQGTLTLKAFPNPSYGALSIQIFALADFSNSSLEIYDLQGKLVQSVYSGVIPAGNKTIDFQSKLSTGQYFLQLKANNETISLPVIIMK
jgi:hypothetical protein